MSEKLTERGRERGIESKRGSESESGREDDNESERTKSNEREIWQKIEWEQRERERYDAIECNVCNATRGNPSIHHRVVVVVVFISFMCTSD